MNSDQLFDQIARCQKRQRIQYIEHVLKSFSWGDYGFDKIKTLLRENPDGQQWLMDLAAQINNAITGI